MVKKFKTIEKSKDSSPDIQWEGEEVTALSETQLTDDKGTGNSIVLRFFDFGANPEVFKKYKPTAQELFDSHRKGIVSLLWKDGLVPYNAVEPRLLFSKDMSHYRFVIACTSNLSNTFVDKPQTLSQLLTNSIT